MKSITSLFVFTSFILSTGAFSQSYESYEYGPEMEEEIIRDGLEYESEFAPQHPHGEEYAPGEIEQQEEDLYLEDTRDWNLSEEELPVEYYE